MFCHELDELESAATPKDPLPLGVIVLSLRGATAAARSRVDHRVMPEEDSNPAGSDQARAFKRVETRCRVTPKRSAICSIVRPSA
jgi:hypothetical protein